MGLDIYFHKLKKNVATESVTDWTAISKECTRQSREKLAKVYDRAILSLLNANANDYKETYKRVIKEICKFSAYPQFAYCDLGVYYDYKNDKYSYYSKPIEVFIEKMGDILEKHYAPQIAYFRKANFVYAFFSNKLENERAWVTKEDLKDLIDRCERVLVNHTLAKELLPTKEGDFFGSTKYDELYFNDVKDCLKQMKKVLKGFKDDELVYVVMSW